MVATLVATGCFDPAPHVLVTVDDPHAIAANAVALRYGADLGNMGEVETDGERFPLTLALSADEPRDGPLWVDAIDEDDRVLGRGFAEVRMRRKKTHTAKVRLEYACDTAPPGASCVTSLGILDGSCIEGDCVSPAWTHNYDSPEGGDDEIRGAATGPNGEVFVAGTSSHGVGGNGFVQRYNRHGVLLWTDVFDSKANVIDDGTGIAVDSQDNVIVAATIARAGLYTDIWVRKHDSQGNVLWTRSWGSGVYEYAGRVTVDSQDAVIVVGSRSSFSAPARAFAAKLDADGETIWQHEYPDDGDLSRHTFWAGVTVDNGDDIIAVGSTSDGVSGDVRVARLSATTGEAETIAIFGTAGHDEAWDAAVDPDTSDILVTGRVDAVGQAFGPGQLWVARFTGAGSLLWSEQRGADLGDTGYGIGIDSTGAVVVAGTVNTSASSGEAWIGKLDANGIEIWSETFSDSAAFGMTVDALDRIVVSGALDSKPLIRQLDPDGNVMWSQTRSWQGAGANQVTVTSTNDIVWTGHEPLAAGDRNLVIEKLRVDGFPLWTELYNDPRSDDPDQASAIVFAGDRVVAAGSSWVTAEGYRPWLRAYTLDGVLIWSTGPPGELERHVEVNGLCLWGDELVMVGSQRTYDDEWRYDIWIARYHPNGILRDTATFDGSDGTHDFAFGCTAYADELFVVGQANVPLTQGNDTHDIWLGRLDSSLNLLQSVELTGPDDGWDTATEIAVDSRGDLGVVGSMYSDERSSDVWYGKYDRSLNQLWSSLWDGPAHGSDSGTSVAFDADDNLIVAGMANTRFGADAWVRKVGPAGDEIWTQTYDGAASGGDAALSVAVGADGYVVVGGWEENRDGKTDAWVRQYAP